MLVHLSSPGISLGHSTSPCFSILPHLFSVTSPNHAFKNTETPTRSFYPSRTFAVVILAVFQGQLTRNLTLEGYTLSPHPTHLLSLSLSPL